MQMQDGELTEKIHALIASTGFDCGSFEADFNRPANPNKLETAAG